MVKVLFALFLFSILLTAQQNTGRVRGEILNSADSLPVPGCNVIIKETSGGNVTNSAGQFSFILPFGSYTLIVSHVSFRKEEISFNISELNPDIPYKIFLKPDTIQTQEVSVISEREVPSTILREIKSKDLDKMPNVFNDAMRAVHLMPGVISTNELSSGYNVRGGNFDDNLIYLNGYEIYRPFMLRTGVEENQSLLNPDLTSEIKFYNGSFPASYGDKMASALEVNYNLNDIDTFKGKIRGDFLNSALTLYNKIGDIKLAGAFRYTYPGMFLNKLTGDYKSNYTDLQILAGWKLNSFNEIEAFILYANNKFGLTPAAFLANIGTASTNGTPSPGSLSIYINYEGNRTYTFKTGLAGVRHIYKYDENTILKTSFAMYSTAEDERSDISSDWIVPGSVHDLDNAYYISGIERVTNKLDLITYEFYPRIETRISAHFITAGFNLRLTNVNNIVSEEFIETSNDVAAAFPIERQIDQEFQLNSYSAFIQDDITLSENIFINSGIRCTYYNYSKELLFSPRMNFAFSPSSRHTFTLGWGFYFQPPYYCELRNKPEIEQSSLKAQKAVHYSLGWEYIFKEKRKLDIQLYYKKLTRLIPYFIDRDKTEYMDANSHDGFAYGTDITLQGEFVQGMNSWVSYSYLNTQEKRTNGENAGNYYRRLTDNTHSFQVFIQDRIRKHPNWQSHFRMILNTGYVYNTRRIVTNENDVKVIKVLTDQVTSYPGFYFRADMGLSASFDMGGPSIVFIAEILNVFDNKNYGNYRFIIMNKIIESPIAVAQELSRRFFNFGAEIKF